MSMLQINNVLCRCILLAICQIQQRTFCRVFSFHFRPKTIQHGVILVRVQCGWLVECKLDLINLQQMRNLVAIRKVYSINVFLVIRNSFLIFLKRPEQRWHCCFCWCFTTSYNYLFLSFFLSFSHTQTPQLDSHKYKWTISIYCSIVKSRCNYRSVFNRSLFIYGLFFTLFS